MLNNKSVAVVIPCYNEEQQIGMVIESMPGFVDLIVVINDKSRDNTAAVIESYFDSPLNRENGLIYPSAQRNFNRYQAVDQLLVEYNNKEERFYPKASINHSLNGKGRIVLINHLENYGKGGGIISGYKFCRDHAVDCVAAMDGDGQMDPSELESLCLPIAMDDVDYTKGNRLHYPGAALLIPRVRFLGNSVLTILTKIASGYWHMSDTQTGYTAISCRALHQMVLHKIFRYYGYPNDLLVKLNIADCSLKEVVIKPVYHIGEKSKMKIPKVIGKVSLLLLRMFFVRLWEKYLFRSFHPLFICYHLGLFMLLISCYYVVKVGASIVTNSEVGVLPVLALMFLVIGGIQFILFGMWMDIQDNERLNR